VYIYIILSGSITELIGATALLPLERTPDMLVSAAGVPVRAIVATWGTMAAARGMVTALPAGHAPV
jgi:hypothetical protein